MKHTPNPVIASEARQSMRQLYAPFNRNHERTRVMDVKSGYSGRS